MSTFDKPFDLAVGDVIEFEGLPNWRYDVVQADAYGADLHCTKYNNSSAMRLNYAQVTNWSPWRRVPTTIQVTLKFEPPKPVGMACERCKNFNEYAGPNMPNGLHVCRGCREDGYGTKWAVSKFQPVIVNSGDDTQ